MSIGPEKILLFLFIALVVLGPDKLPQAARKAGRVITELRRMSQGLSGELSEALATITKAGPDHEPPVARPIGHHDADDRGAVRASDAQTALD